MSKENIEMWEKCPKWICFDCDNTTFLLRKCEDARDLLFPDICCAKCGSLAVKEKRD
jgi:hypothetical protein|tara:strand:- start:14339 stop:14509 length:171 start_codon:yes stop_codon:yes gene_type:complete